MITWNNDLLAHPYFEELEADAWRAGFGLRITDSGLQFDCSDSEYARFGPKMSATVYEEDGIYYFVPELSMPKCTGDDVNFADSFEYLGDLYMNAAKLATYLMKYPFDPEMWEE